MISGRRATNKRSDDPIPGRQGTTGGVCVGSAQDGKSANAPYLCAFNVVLSELHWGQVTGLILEGCFSELDFFQEISRPKQSHLPARCITWEGRDMGRFNGAVHLQK